MKYLVVIEPTNTGYSAYSPDLPGCASTGQSREECEKNMHDAIEFHLNGLREDGEPIPKPGNVCCFREQVTVLMHLEGGITKVGTRFGGDWDIPTHKIPIKLRTLGSCFTIAGKYFEADPNDSPDESRRKLNDQVIEFYELSDK